MTEQIPAILLGLDLGSKRTGIALYDRATNMAVPLETIHADSFGLLFQQLEVLIQERSVGGLILGLPLQSDGNEGEQAAFCRKFARFFSYRNDLPVYWQDERLTSVAADQIHQEANYKGDRDGSAALLILEDFVGR